MNSFTRRQSLALGAAATAALLTPKAFAAAPGGLHALAAAKGLGFGSCISAGGGNFSIARMNSGKKPRPSLLDDPNLLAVMAKECGIIVPSNELKWYSLRPDAEHFTFERGDQLADYAEANHMKMRGHTLLWNDTTYFPDWLANYDFGPKPRAPAEKMLTGHIRTVCQHYGKRIFTYDVINETIDRHTGVINPTVFTKAIGPEVIDLCFHTAREAAPHAELVLNDFMSWEPGAEKAIHRNAMLKLLERLKKNKVPVDVLGVQSHIGSNRAPGVEPTFFQTDLKAWRGFLDEAVGMGYGLAITELDINDKGIDGDIPARDKAVASLTKDYLDLMLSYKEMRYVMTWGMVDKYSWEQGFTPRLDNLPRRPLPYDDAYQPKPMREAMADAFRAAPVRPSTLG
jgi:endo-1,4-beta-xylanase